MRHQDQLAFARADHVQRDVAMPPGGAIVLEVGHDQQLGATQARLLDRSDHVPDDSCQFHADLQLVG